MHAVTSDPPLPSSTTPSPATPSSATPSPAPAAARSTAARSRRDIRTSELTEELRVCSSEIERRRIQQELVSVNMPVAEAIAGRYRDRGIPTADLVQVAYLALVKSTRRFDPDAGFAFLAFSVPTIRGEVRRYFRDHGWMVRPPRRIQELQSAVLRARSDLSSSLGRSPSPEEIATALDHDLAEVLEALDGKGCFRPASLEAPAGEHAEATLADLLETEERPFAAVEARITLEPALRRLGARDRRILQLRYVEGLTQREIAEIIGVTQMQVSRLLARIYAAMRSVIGEQLHDSPQAS